MDNYSSYDKCFEGSDMTITRKAKADMMENEATHCENFFHHLEMVEEHLLEAIKVGRFTYGKQISKAMLMAELEDLLDSAIAEYGKEI